MIETNATLIELGSLKLKINLIANREQILTDSMNEDETPLWVELWPSALALARLLWDGESLTGISILELGAGLGLPGTVAGLKGASVLQTDYMPEALDVAKETAKMNNVENLRTAVADWRNFDITENFDLIIGSDIMYHPELNPYLKKIFLQNLNPGGKIIMGDAGRRDSLAFVESLVLEGWGVTEKRVPVKQDRFDYNIYVFDITPPESAPL
ncbi:MAG TPA: methyltransferase domain-containing protein [Desulfobacteria bacterium]|nr:methyltransferase domain-containing protein [Desulfobacteria bacterium]